MTKKREEAKTTIKKVTKPTTKGSLDQANKTVTVQKVIMHRVLKYKYPRDCKEVLKRKSFRQKVRNTIRTMERKIATLKGEERRVLKIELATYLQENLC